MSQTASPFHAAVEMQTGAVKHQFNRETQQRLYIAALLISDTLMLALAFSGAYAARFVLRFDIFETSVTPLPGFYARLTCLLVMIWLLMYYMFRAYDWENLLGGTHEYAQIVNACTTVTVLVITAGYFLQNFLVARGWLATAWVLTMLCTNVARFGLRHLVYTLRRFGYFVTPALIVGANEEAVALAQQLAGWSTSGLNVLGAVSDDVLPGYPVSSRLTALGNLAALPDLIARCHVEEVIVASSAISPTQLLEIFRQYGTHDRVSLRLSSGLFDIINTGLSVKSLGYVPLISVNKVRLSELEAGMKLCLDLVASTLGLILIAPLMGVIALAVRLDSPGPVIYRRGVLGRGGIPFDAFKFRTMYLNGNDLLTPEQRAELAANCKLKNDPRITRMGRFLRKYSLDELPQLINILRGQMSLVGPRMITPDEKNKYGKWDMNLLTVKPGLSGLWQISGRSDVSYEERVRLDMQYIRNYTIWLDLQILVRTFLVVLKGKGAY
jgi:exopolysaccharide biosynthesis polyprenyl glycosylphosphotransferase